MVIYVGCNVKHDVGLSLSLINIFLLNVISTIYDVRHNALDSA